MPHCDGDVAPALGVKEGIGEGSGATQLHMWMVTMACMITIWLRWHVC